MTAVRAALTWMTAVRDNGGTAHSATDDGGSDGNSVDNSGSDGTDAEGNDVEGTDSHNTDSHNTGSGDTGSGDAGSASADAGTGSGWRTGSIRLGNVHNSAVGIGNHHHIETVRHEATPRDPAYERLSEAIQQLGEDLARVVPSSQTVALADELSGAQDEIQRTGQASPGRLARLRTLLQDASASIGMLASGVAVGQAIGPLIGG
ncbi:hypothetical protein [Streptomyces zagrosensis]|uniref:Uncharacterized protein n=1 Tax=Streptomyces zagrosensis TaxID=1042984 RepID=A0A7W9UXL4_9ACTN|nr:hypothetical protein [Streptomyces zagrosensis]MBB5934772.1 hypothetical protein [Streptomyces zagrosensis]